MATTKVMNKKGFTLLEMLIVVVIIIVLVSVSAPIFSSQLNQARNAVDDANVRSAKAFASAMYMLSQEDFDTKMYFDKDNEAFVAEKPSPYGQSQENSTKVISAIWNPTTENIDITWE